MVTPHLFCFGLGYTARTISTQLAAQGYMISGTYRSEEKTEVLVEKGITRYRYGQMIPAETITHLLISIPPTESSHIVISDYAETLAQMPHIKWVGYLSTTGVYGDQKGNWVTEKTPVAPTNERLKRRVEAENIWLKSELPVHIFRLAGIYGPERSVIKQLQLGTARRIDKKEQVFSRIHVEDIAKTLKASIDKPNPGSLYNVADDLPEAQEKVVAYAAKLLGIEPPPLTPIGQADMSEMARSFYQNNRRVDNSKIKQELNVKLTHPTYKEGLKSIVEKTKSKR